MTNEKTTDHRICIPLFSPRPTNVANNTGRCPRFTAVFPLIFRVTKYERILRRQMKSKRPSRRVQFTMDATKFDTRDSPASGLIRSRTKVVYVIPRYAPQSLIYAAGKARVVVAVTSIGNTGPQRAGLWSTLVKWRLSDSGRRVINYHGGDKPPKVKANRLPHSM